MKLFDNSVGINKSVPTKKTVNAKKCHTGYYINHCHCFPVNDTQK